MLIIDRSPGSLENKHMFVIAHWKTIRFIRYLQSYRYRYSFTREGQKVLATIFFLFTWVHLYKGGKVYIMYEPLSFMLYKMDSVARLVALNH